MDLSKILDELRAERDCLNDAITSLERLLPGGAKESNGPQTVKRPGRPPANQKAAE